MPDPRDVAVIILAAGQGTRMKSPQLPKVLHRLGSLTLIERVLQTVLPLAPAHCWIVVGYEQEQVRQALAAYPVTCVVQEQQKGTGHAAQQVLPYLDGFEGTVLVLNGDVPLLRPQTIQALVARHQAHQADVTLLTAQVGDPTGYGRVFCQPSQDDTLWVNAIIEHRDCTPTQRQENRINAGVYCFAASALRAALPDLQPNNQQQEYYLTDVVGMVPKALAVDVPDPAEIQGINDRQQLATAYDVLQQRIKTAWMQAGVTMIDPASITIDDQVQLSANVIVEPQTHLRGTTTVGQGSRLGPGSLIENSQIGQHCQILFSVVSDSQIGDHSTIGPYTHVRQHSQVSDHCRVGNFVEVKKTSVGSHTNAAHLSYLGDGQIGERVNIGAGTIFANYDGVHKHRTIIGQGSKTGANSVLVAPIMVGENVTIAAGSTIAQDIPDDCLVIARPQPTLKPGWRLALRPSDPT